MELISEQHTHGKLELEKPVKTQFIKNCKKYCVICNCNVSIDDVAFCESRPSKHFVMMFDNDLINTDIIKVHE